MEDSTGLPPLRRLPAGVLGMLVLVGAIERFVGRHDVDFSNPVVANWRYAEESARRGGPGREVLCFGSSLANHGLLPSVIEEIGGRPARNMAVFGGTMPGTYYLVKHALESGVRPDVIVLDCADSPARQDRRSGSGDLWVRIRQWPEVLTLADSVDLAWNARDAGFLASMVVSRVLPSARARFEIRESIRAALGGRPSSSFVNIAIARRNWRVNRGANVVPIGMHREGDRLTLPPRGHRFGWSPDRLTEAYARRLLELTGQRGVPVVWVMPPVGPAVKTWREHTGLAAHATEFARQMKAEFPGMTILDGRDSGYPEAAFTDGLHLNRDGAVTFSADVASALADRPGAVRTRAEWVRLPPYRGRRSAVPIEDVDQSRVAVLDALWKSRPTARR